MKHLACPGLCVSLIAVSALVACGRRGDPHTTGGASATVVASAPPAPAAASASARPGLRALASAAPPTVSQVHPAKVVIGACSFELTAPEPLQAGARDSMSASYSGKHVRFQGFAGASLGLGPTTLWAKPETTLFVDEERDPALVVSRNPSAPRPMDAVSGSGAEKYLPERSRRPDGLGCAFVCGGEAAFEGDVLAMCKSVRITYGAAR